MARPRPTEVRMVANALEKAFTESDEVDLNVLAGTLIESLDAARAARQMYAGVAYIPLGDGGVWKGLGPFSTPKQAQKAINQLVAPGPRPGVGRVVALVSGVD